ncbi:MAG: Transcriptional regulator [uncultured Campylobacterales bacterium]|uniref:Transcriptional regulator n=1 Tax=uncultured Campylobacterales bacterium TaxID=352960 RepID=A0A6S6SVQ0_9BACT|nr:MAG: Transcriptional regulator [uncultured Campylobacterales bacterium]
MKDKSRLYRILSIISELELGKKLSTKELSNKYKIDIRTIQRDFKEYILELRPEIQKQNNKYFLNSKTKSSKENIIISIFQNIADNIGGEFSKNANELFSKLKDDENILYTQINIENISDKLDITKEIQNAIKNKTTIKCEYSINNSSYKATINPLKLANYSGYWYLIAIDNKDKVLKKYYFNEIQKVSLTNKIFTYEKNLDKILANAISIWFEPKEPYEVQLLVSATISKYFQRQALSPTQRIMKEYKDKSIEISIDITNDMEIIPIIKSYIPHIKVIVPQRIKDKIQKDIEKYMSN